MSSPATRPRWVSTIPRGTFAVRRDGSGVWYKAGTGVNDWVQLAPGATPLESLLSVFGSGATDPADA